jgi:RNA polymerase sigma factor (sigma-70 family)
MTRPPTPQARAVRALAVRLAIARNSAGGAAEAARLRREMIEANLRLLWKVATRHAGPRLTGDEAASLGYEALERAVDAYDPFRTPPVAFNTLAYLAIDRKIRQKLATSRHGPARTTADPAAAARRLTDPGPAPGERLERAESRAACRDDVAALLARLGPRAGPLRLRYGLDGTAPLPHAELGRAIGKSPSAARWEVHALLSELREFAAADPRWRDRYAC